MGQYDGALHLFFRDGAGNPKRGLVIDLADGSAALTTHNEGATCVCVDNRYDKLYLMRDPATATGEGV